MPDPFAPPTDPRVNYTESNWTLTSGLTAKRYPFTRETKQEQIRILRVDDTAELKVIDTRITPLLGRAPTAREAQMHLRGDLLKAKDGRSTFEKLTDASREKAAEKTDVSPGDELRVGGDLENDRLWNTPSRRRIRDKLRADADAKDAEHAELEAQAAAKAEREADPVYQRAVDFGATSLRLSQREPTTSEADLAAQRDRLTRLQSGSLLAVDFWKEIEEEENNDG